MELDEDTVQQPAHEHEYGDYALEFEPEPPPVRSRRRFGRLTAGLLAAVVAAAGFFAGVEVQKHQGSATQVTAAAATAAGRAGRQGRGTFGGGGTGGFAGIGAGGAGGGGGGGGTPEVGQVQTIDGSTLYVTDFQGNTVKVTTSPSSRVTKSQQLTVNDVRPGDTVVIQGTQQSDGSYTADSVTVGGAGGATSGG